MKFATKAIHVGEEPGLGEGASGDVVAPIHLSTTFARREIEHPTGGYEYSRTGNPTRDALEARLAALEDARHGMAFASGLAAEATVFFSLLRAGDHVVAFDDLYGGTRRLFSHVLDPFGVTFTYADAVDPANAERAIRPQTRIIWLETPTNPLMKLCDIAAIAALARGRGILTVVDNTFATPYFQRPLDLGADVVVHSATKYLGGHSDVVAGAVMLSDDRLAERIRFNQNAIGAVPSPFDCFLVLRGIKTLAVRMERHDQNGRRIAAYLMGHRKVRRVNYPGLASHPQHELARRQMTGFGGMISFEIDGALDDARAFLRRVRLFALAESLGGVESLIEHPALMTHASIPAAERERVGISDTLIRLSVGIEDVDDLVADLEQAFG